MHPIDLDTVRILPPIPKPPKIICVGRVMQDANTAQLIFSVSALIELISVAMSLEPGDVIITPAASAQSAA
jgi:2-keto-4-pentenoate hydratase/2-oxohepta-3-ene-1,7-dioic acid hydratase in catechol pathway